MTTSSSSPITPAQTTDVSKDAVEAGLAPATPALLKTKKTAGIKKNKAKESSEEQWVLLSAGSAAAILALSGPEAKRMSRYAFSGSHQECGPYAPAGADGLDSLVGDLLDYMMSNWSSKNLLSTLPDRFQALSSAAAQGAHSHPGKYVHPSSSEKWLSPPQSNDYDFLTSRSAGNVRWLSSGFSHAPEMTKPGLLFYAQFELADSDDPLKITCLGQMLSRNDPRVIAALVARGIPQAHVAAAVYEWSKAFSNNLSSNTGSSNSNLPTLLWPRFNPGINGHQGSWDYTALTALPSFATYNAIRKMTRRAYSQGFRIAATSFSVGSGQAQNISVAATHTSGSIGLLKCAPPSLRQDEKTLMLRKAGAKKGLALINKIPDEFTETIRSSASSIAAWPNLNRKIKIRALASKHVALALAPMLQLFDLLAASPSPDDLPNGMNQHIKRALLGQGVSAADRQEWLELIFSPTTREALSAHAQQDQDAYMNAAWAAIGKSLGLAKSQDSNQPNEKG